MKRASKYIDLASIKCVSKEEIAAYTSKPDYYRLLTKSTYFYHRYPKDKSSLFGTYYIKLVNKPRAISQFIKKEHIFKIDKQFVKSQLLSDIKKVCVNNQTKSSPMKDFDFPENKTSIVNILDFNLDMLDKCLMPNETDRKSN